jgi:NYN domain
MRASHEEGEMAVKIMVFIDGSWLFHNRQHIAEVFDLDHFEIDYGRIPPVIAGHITGFLQTEVDVVRTHYYGAIPVNKPGFNPAKQQTFFNYLASRCFFETEIYDIDFRHDPSSRPKEKCVDIALASAMLYFAAVPNAYDIAVLLAGDLDYLPVIRRVRSLGKRTLLVALKEVGTYFPTSKILLESPNLFDLPHLFLDDHLEEIRLKRETVSRPCETCGRVERTTWPGDVFYCTSCRNRHQAMRKRTCDTCGKIEETNWTGQSFYCDECRDAYRGAATPNRGTGP